MLNSASSKVCIRLARLPFVNASSRRAGSASRLYRPDYAAPRRQAGESIQPSENKLVSAVIVAMPSLVSSELTNGTLAATQIAVI